MITKINRIKNLGLVFSDFSWDSTVSNFNKFNIIYGWNGSGKTTFSRLFDAIEGVPMKDLEYEIEDDQHIKYKQQENFPKKIRVFNQDYIKNNVRIFEGRANSISILLGEENKELINIIEIDKKVLNGEPGDTTNSGLVSSYDGYIKKKKYKIIEHDRKFTEIARTIGAAIGGNALRDYRKPQAESEFAGMESKIELSDDDLAKFTLVAKQESIPENDTISLKQIEIKNNKEELITFFQSANDKAKIILARKVESEIITRFSENEEISEWVERGINLHKIHSSDVCEYCAQKIPGERIRQLAKHFNNADKEIKNELEELLLNIYKAYTIIKDLQLPDRARLYPVLRDVFDEKRLNFVYKKTKTLKQIGVFIEGIKNKKIKTVEALTLETAIDISDFISSINDVNKIIDAHNKTTLDFERVRDDAINKLKKHYLSTIFDEVKKYKSDILELSNNISSLGIRISGLNKKIFGNMAKISSKHKACDYINKKLETFLGRKELTFVPQSEKEINENGEKIEIINGYNIMRGENPAEHLSEGEKTAIAFVYFVVHLGDENFEIRDGIVVIDDPISSLDSNSLYQAFSFLKNSVKDGFQIFILTHNFDFLKLLMNWRKGSNDNRKKTNYFMIKNVCSGDSRCACIDKMDKELREYESEYHYLFKLLKQLRDSQDGSIEKAYPVPNIARKVWDTFLMFAVPNGKGIYQKIEELKSKGFNSQKMDAIYKFTNDQSHITGSGFDPSLVPETKKVTEEIFEMMKLISLEHFTVLDNATN